MPEPARSNPSHIKEQDTKLTSWPYCSLGIQAGEKLNELSLPADSVNLIRSLSELDRMILSLIAYEAVPGYGLSTHDIIESLIDNQERTTGNAIASKCMKFEKAGFLSHKKSKGWQKYNIWQPTKLLQELHQEGFLQRITQNGRHIELTKETTSRNNPVILELPKQHPEISKVQINEVNFSENDLKVATAIVNNFRSGKIGIGLFNSEITKLLGGELSRRTDVAVSRSSIKLHKLGLLEQGSGIPNPFSPTDIVKIWRPTKLLIEGLRKGLLKVKE